MLSTMQRFLVPAVLFVSFATLAYSDQHKAVALAAPRPIKSTEASQRHLAGDGVFVLQVDKASGKVTSIQTKKSTGQPLLTPLLFKLSKSGGASLGQFPQSPFPSNLVPLKILLDTDPLCI